MTCSVRYYIIYKGAFTMKRFSALVLVSILLVVLSGCGGDSASGGLVPGQIQEAYGYTHGGYVGRSVVRVSDDGSLDVEIDEAFLPHTLAVVALEDEWTEENTVYYMSRGNEVRVAKYVVYDDTTYVGTTVGGGLMYVEADENGEPAGGKDLELAIVRNQATMAAYFANVQGGGFKLLTGFDGEPIAVTETRYGGVTKKTSPGYWDSGQTWVGNIQAIEAFIEENGWSFSPSEMVRATQANADGLKFWSVADAVTGATNADFKDYFSVTQLAASRLKWQ